MDEITLFELKGKGMAPMHLLKQHPDMLSDHGRHCNQQDIISLALHTKAISSLCVAPNGVYELLSIAVSGATDTVLMIAGGDQHPYCLDSTIYPNGFLLPGNLLDKWHQYNINAILLIPPYLLDYGWGNIAGDRKNSHKIIEKVFNRTKAKTYINNIFTKVLNFYQDLDFILTVMPQEQKMWVAGHCTSADALSRYCAISSFIKPHGMIMWNPSWRQSNQASNVEKYFVSQGESRLLVVQHEQDSSPGVSLDIAKKIVDEYEFENKKLVVLKGGENHGLPCFSMGHHGFRGIEDQLVRATAEFINNSFN